MSTFSKLEMIDAGGNSYTIVIEVGMGKILIADKLGRDEALGVIAALLFKDIARVPYARPLAALASHQSEGQQ